jgi:hypothetical protein
MEVMMPPGIQNSIHGFVSAERKKSHKKHRTANESFEGH